MDFIIFKPIKFMHSENKERNTYPAEDGPEGNLCLIFFSLLKSLTHSHFGIQFRLTHNHIQVGIINAYSRLQFG